MVWFFCVYMYFIGVPLLLLRAVLFLTHGMLRLFRPIVDHPGPEKLGPAITKLLAELTSSVVFGMILSSAYSSWERLFESLAALF